MAEKSADLKHSGALHPLAHILPRLDVVMVPLIIIDIAVYPPTERAENKRTRPPALGDNISSELRPILEILLRIGEVEHIERGLKLTEHSPEISHRFRRGQIAADREHPASSPEPSDPVILGLIAKECWD